MKHLPVLFLSIIFLWSCGNETVSSNSGQNTANKQDSIGGTAGSFYKRMEGKIGNQQSVMHFHKYGNFIQATVFFSGDNAVYTLCNFQEDAVNGTYKLYETSSDRNANQSNLWYITIENDEVKGKRTDSAGHEIGIIALKEKYPEGTMHFDAYYLTDTGHLFRTLPDPKAYTTFGMLYPTRNSPAEPKAFLISCINQAMKLDGQGNVNEGLKTRAWRYFSNYRLDLKDIVDSTSPPEELKLGGYTYFTSFYHRVVFNDNNWVVLEDNIANFTGGAHGMYSNTYQNLDLSISKKWSLRDIVKDTATLQPLLEIAARNYFGIKNEEDISERLLVETIPVTPNVYITSSGLFFVYQPYEIASYADGLISLYIPYNQIISLLSPPFLKRMGLDTQAGVAMLN